MFRVLFHLLSFSLSFSDVISIRIRVLSRMISEDVDDQAVGAALEELNDCVVHRVLVLLQPASQVVRYSSGVVNNSKMRILVNQLELNVIL